MICCEVVTKPSGIFPYRDVWNSLFNSGAYEVSTSFEWTHALLTTHLNKNDLFVLIIIKDSEEVVGIVPLIVNETKKYGQSINTLFPISEYYNTHSDILLKYQSEQVVGAFIACLSEIKNNWDVFRVGRFVETNPTIKPIETYLKKTSMKYSFSKEDPSFFVALDDTYSAYLKKRSGKFRNHLKRMKKKLAALGHVRLVRLGDFNSLTAAYERLLHVEEKSWKYCHGTAIINVKKQEKFYRELCEYEYGTGRLHLLFLYLDELAVAYNLGVLKDNKYLYLKTSFDEEFKKASPATVLRAELIKELTSKGIEYFDFPGEPYEWERQWADDIQWHKSLIIYNNTFKAKLFSFYNTVRSKRKNTDSKDQINYHNPLDVKDKKVKHSLIS